MFEFIIVLSIIIAAAIVFLSYIIDIFQNLKFRNHLILVCGILYVLIMLVINPDQVTQHDLYGLKAFSQLILFPLFVIVPLLYIEQWTGTVFSKFSVFFGAAMIVNYYYAFLIYGNYYFDQFWQVDGLVWTAGTLVPAFLVFFGIYLCQKFLSSTYEAKTSQSVPGKETNSPFLGIVLIAGLLAFCFPSFLIASLGDFQSCGGFEVYPIDQSQISNSTVIHLTENDFRNFSRMASLIRDGKIISGGCMSSKYDPNTCIGKNSFRCNEGQQFAQYKEKYLEFNGRYYIIVQSYVV